MTLDEIAVLIPALNPNHKLVELVKQLFQLGFIHILVLDDGSEDPSQMIFEEVQASGARVYRHQQNRGKGASIKTGIQHIRKNQIHCRGIITADADGQHTPGDILKVANALMAVNMIVLGTRDLSRPEVPLASKFGNKFSALYYRVKTGRVLEDTQTGLRGIPARYFDFALGVEGDRYEYEMRFLEQMSEKNIDYRTVEIETIYEADRVTHFRAIRDSFVIYRSFFKNIGSSLLSAMVDITLFMVLVKFGNTVFSATAAARILSGLFNFSLNKIWVFEKKDSHNTRNESLKYLALFVIQMILSGVLTGALNNVLNFQYSLLFSKIAVDCFLFVTNFLVQRFWVFPVVKKIGGKMKNKHAFAYLYTALLITATVWSLLDTFVIADRVTAVNAALANTSIYSDPPKDNSSGSSSISLLEEDSSQGGDSAALASEGESSLEAPVITDYSYQDSNIEITIDKIRQYDTDIYVADVVVSDVAYLKTALADNTYGRNIKDTTSDMAQEHGAILAINGDYYGFRKEGIVIRNGVLYQATARDEGSEALVVNADGSFEIVDEARTDPQKLYEEGALQVFTFGPGLISDGEITVSKRSEVSQSMRSNPRTAIGMIDELHYIFVVSDGRTSQNAGLSLLELAEVMQEYGCTVAYNLDGGGSATMVFNGEVINNPTDGRKFGERKVSDIIYIGESL